MISLFEAGRSPSFRRASGALALVATVGLSACSGGGGTSGPSLAASTTNCSGIATFSPTTGTGPSASFTVTSQAAGSCTVTVADANNQKVGVAVTVTTTSGTINTRRR